MTTTFNNSASAAVEDAAMSVLRREWALKRFRRLGDEFSEADYGIEFEDGAQAVVEIKGRSRSFLGGPLGVEIARKKIDALRRIGARYGVAARLVFVFLIDRSMWWVDASVIDIGYSFSGGRRPRPGAANDQEVMVFIPFRDLNRIRESIDGGAADNAIAYNKEHANG